MNASIRRAGVTLPELILVAWLFGLVLLGLARFASAQGRLAGEAYDRVRAADLVRTVDLILEAELRYAAAPDLAVTPDSIRLRAVRGSGVICGRTGAVVRIRYRGVRRPDPGKDSVLIITDSTTAGAAYRIDAVAAAVPEPGCGAGYRLTLQGTPPGRGLVLVFETGSYHLADGAFRYRRGRAGRQPVTEAVLADGAFERRLGSLAVRLVLSDDSLPRLPAHERAAVLRLLNLDPP